ncbi:MAG: hypothetical protein ISN28_09255 [Ectothiorhodospiraceae bacterium AqS1]|nr:hypothetical protein [Ectothiorhodospiraceae bacterium AqS1]
MAREARASLRAVVVAGQEGLRFPKASRAVVVMPVSPFSSMPSEADVVGFPGPRAWEDERLTRLDD